VDPVDPFKQQLREWVFGSEDFLRRMIALAEGGDRHRHESTIRRVHAVTVRELGPAFGLTGTDSVSNLVHRAEQQSKRSASMRKMRKTANTTKFHEEP